MQLAKKNLPRTRDDEIIYPNMDIYVLQFDRSIGWQVFNEDVYSVTSDGYTYYDRYVGEEFKITVKNAENRSFAYRENADVWCERLNILNEGIIGND